MTIEDPQAKSFMLELYSMTGGDTDSQVSMYEVGESLGLEKADASALAQDLIISDWVELKTLSGGVGITTKGLEALDVAISGTGSQTGLSLGNDVVLSVSGSEALHEVLERVKEKLSSASAKYDRLEELVIDIKTIDTQLLSPRPKTAVIRETLHSIASCLEECGLASERDMVTKMVSQ